MLGDAIEESSPLPCVSCSRACTAQNCSNQSTVLVTAKLLRPHVLLHVHQEVERIDTAQQGWESRDCCGTSRW